MPELRQRNAIIQESLTIFRVPDEILSSHLPNTSHEQTGCTRLKVVYKKTLSCQNKTDVSDL